MSNVSPWAIGAVAIALAVVLAIMAWTGFDERSAPIAVTLAGSIATVSAAMVAASRAGKAADHAEIAAGQAGAARHQASRSASAAEFTASQTAALQQTLLAHCGDICPHPDCPLRRRDV